MKTATPCPDVANLEHFSLGQVRELEAESLEAHLAGCPHCVETLHALKDADTLVEAMRAQSTLLARPKIDETVSQLMAALKSMSPALSGQGCIKSGEKGHSACQELIDFLAPPQAPDEMGRLGSYRILRVLGAGGMGVVFAAEDVQLRRPVALKALRPLLAASSTARKRFLREAQAAAAVSHDYVASIYQVGVDRGVPFIAMQYLAGETLEARLQREGPLPLADILHIGRQLAEGLSAAHGQGLLHRDIKPANLWLESRQGEVIRVKILDFGLAWIADSAEPLTDHGTVVGTPPYMAPEQARGEPADVRSDLFSLGSVLYAMCTGQAPFQGSSTFATLEMVRKESPKPLRDLNPAIPTWLAEVVTKLHAKHPADRFQTASEVAAQLQDSAPRTKKGRWRWWMASAAALLLASLAGLGLCEATGLTQMRDLFAEVPNQGLDNAVVQNGNNEEKIPGTQKDRFAICFQQPEPIQEEVKAPVVYPAALFPFEERGTGVRDHATKVTDLLFAKLAAKPELFLVDRADLKKTLAELELNLSGIVKPGEAAKIGQLTGAKLLISGSVIQVDKRTYLVAKIVGTETSRVIGVSVDGKSSDELAPLIDKLAELLADKITKEADKLVAKTTPAPNRIAALNQKLKKGVRPTVMIKISERHIGALRIDPAAQTELTKFCKETGFNVLDPEEGLKAKADIIISGEAFSETAARHGNLVSVKARVELKAVERKTDKIVAIDRQTALVVDLTENIAGKAALQEAAAILAERLLPKLVE